MNQKKKKKIVVEPREQATGPIVEANIKKVDKASLATHTSPFKLAVSSAAQVVAAGSTGASHNEESKEQVRPQTEPASIGNAKRHQSKAMAMNTAADPEAKSNKTNTT
mmetsp:Transcript_19497/g.24085  ORF Transcript_19497/g.24085 Transcript_19497/m.24085 type:complete len:108 (+) Transcript_19497:2130-2453(+)